MSSSDLLYDSCLQIECDCGLVLLHANKLASRFLVGAAAIYEYVAIPLPLLVHRKTTYLDSAAAG